MCVGEYESRATNVVLSQPNTNRQYRVDGTVANFHADFAVDGSTSSHVLSLTSYASDASAEEMSWVLLGPPEAAGRCFSQPQSSSPAL